MKNTKKILLAVSGGPDSMWMLEKYKTHNIVVAHINYNKRPDSKNDQKIVANFCKANNIPLFVKEITKKEIAKTTGNFQNWARQVRYQFFAKIYQSQKCELLYTAHHRDDFLETALMQTTSQRNPLTYGILRKNQLFAMNIERPFLYKYWKKTILKQLKNHQVNYALDSSNDKPIFRRNKLRLEINTKGLIWKYFHFYKYLFLNFKNSSKVKKIEQEYLNWWKLDFDVREFATIEYQEEVIYKFLTKEFENVKISHNKIKAIITFIKSPNSAKFFKLNDHCQILKKKKKLLLFKND